MTVVHDGSAFRSYTGGWVTLPNSTVNDERLSFRARGLLAYLVGRPPGWRFSADRIATCSPTEGREAILTGLRELEQHGYVRRSRLRGSDGRVQTVTEAAATPGLMPSPETGQPTPVQPEPVQPEPVEPTPKSLTEGVITEVVRTEETRGSVGLSPTEALGPVDNRSLSAAGQAQALRAEPGATTGQTDRPLSAQARATLAKRAEVEAAQARAQQVMARRQRTVLPPSARQRAMLDKLDRGGALVRGKDTDGLERRGWVRYEQTGAGDDVVLLTDAGRQVLTPQQEAASG